MSERERWIVYPLLFLALGASLRDKLFDTTTTRTIRCQELIVVDEQPLGRGTRDVAKLGISERVPGMPASGILAIKGQVVVEGPITALHYGFPNRAFVPAIQVPGLIPPEVMRALQQKAAEAQNSKQSPDPKPLAEPKKNP